MKASGVSQEAAGLQVHAERHEEKRSDFREAFYNEAVKLGRDLEPFAEMMRRHPSVVGLIMRGEGLAHSAAEQRFLLGAITE